MSDGDRKFTREELREEYEESYAEAPLLIKPLLALVWHVPWLYRFNEWREWRRIYRNRREAQKERERKG